ncbi:hypothetical protein [Actinomadura sp. 9N407]|uniref:hypothetical protein n=1 Tax=Actinomadura sp. 9N407 TaxID=3375154 RepID=UPI0037A547D6
MTRDAMSRLASARPVQLDPADDPARRARDLDRAFVQLDPARRDLERAFSMDGVPAARRRHPVRWMALTSGLLAVGTAATVAVASLGGGGTVAPETAPSARTILLAAAEKAAKEPSGRYWRLQTISGQARRVGKGADGFTVLTYQTQWDRWTARSDSDSDLISTRDLGARPLTPRDEAAWKRAGSPERMRVFGDGAWFTISTVPGKTASAGSGAWSSDRTTPADKKRLVKMGKKLCAVRKKDGVDVGKALKCRRLDWTAEERLVADDPERFKEYFSSPGLADPAHDLQMGFFFLTEQAAPPAVRSAVFRSLAGTTGVRSIGKVTDGKGRTGIGLAARDVRDGTEYQLILEPGTYKILAGRTVVVEPKGAMTGMRPGDIFDRELVLGSGWTNESPHHP